MHIQDYLQLVINSEKQISEAFTKVAQHHNDEPDIHFTCIMLGKWSEKHSDALEPFRKKYSERASGEKEPERLSQTLFRQPRKGPIALLRDLQDLWLITMEIEISYKIILQAAKALRDTELQSVCENMAEENSRQSSWLQTRIKQAAPQLLVVS